MIESGFLIFLHVAMHVVVPSQSRARTLQYLKLPFQKGASMVADNFETYLLARRCCV